jgi:hypothetical protein
MWILWLTVWHGASFLRVLRFSLQISISPTTPHSLSSDQRALYPNLQPPSFHKNLFQQRHFILLQMTIKYWTLCYLWMHLHKHRPKGGVFT